MNKYKLLLGVVTTMFLMSANSYAEQNGIEVEILPDSEYEEYVPENVDEYAEDEYIYEEDEYIYEEEPADAMEEEEETGAEIY